MKTELLQKSARIGIDPQREFPDTRPMKPDSTNNPECKVCERGSLVRKRLYRFSTPVVVCGYILLVPFSLVFLLCVMAFCAPGNSPVGEAVESAHRAMINADIPGDVMERAVAGEIISDDELRLLSEAQENAVRQANTANAQQRVSGVTDGLARGMTLIIAIVAFLMALPGWILTMKKRVLACTSCGATTQAG